MQSNEIIRFYIPHTVTHLEANKSLEGFKLTTFRAESELSHLFCYPRCTNIPLEASQPSKLPGLHRTQIATK